MKMTGMVPKMLDKSRFTRRLHGLAGLIYSLFMQIGYYFKYVTCEVSYILDSFPVATLKETLQSKCFLSFVYKLLVVNILWFSLKQRSWRFLHLLTMDIKYLAGSC